MSLQDDRRGVLVARRRGFDDDDIIAAVAGVLQTVGDGELLAVIRDLLGIAGAVGNARDLLEIMEYCLGLQVSENFTHKIRFLSGDLQRGRAFRGGAASGSPQGEPEPPAPLRGAGAPDFRPAAAPPRCPPLLRFLPLLYTISPCRAKPRPAISLTKSPN